MYSELMRRRNMKNCTKCTTNKAESEFPKDTRYADGRGSWCYSCKNAQQRLKKYGLVWSKKNPERSKVIKDTYIFNNPEAVQLSKSQWSKANSKKVLAKTRKYQAAKLNATPKWLTKEQLKEMENFYINCPEGYEVDHKTPLQGREVKGLHVPWNLQYLLISDNRRKSNKVA